MNALERVERARKMPEEIETLRQQLQVANQKIDNLQKQIEAMGKALKRHLQQHQQSAKGQSNLLARLLGR